MKASCLIWATTATMLTACVTPPASTPGFDVAALKPTPEGEQVTLTGWFVLDGSFRLYPSKPTDPKESPCVSGVLLSTAGLPPPEYSNRMMTVSGSILRAGSDGAASVADACNSGLMLHATDVSVPE